jgi:hypothetical protein
MSAQNLNMGAALWGLTEESQFALLRKAIVDHELVETNDVVLRFQGTLKPKPRAVLTLAEGERDWKAWDMETEAELPEDSIIADFSGKQYRVMSVTDWSRTGGIYTYVLQEQPPQGAATAAYALGPREPAKVVADILQHGLGLADDAVVLAYEKNLIPKRTGLYVSVDYVGPAKVIANVNELDALGREVQSATLSYLIQMDLLSYDRSAARRFPEAAMSLASIYAVQQMEKYGMSVNRNPSPFVDASSLEPTKRLNRFVSSMVVFSSTKKIIADAAIFTTFPGQLTTGGPLTTLTPAPLEI